MSESDRYIPGVPCWVDIAPPDPDAAVVFYRDLFGWEFGDVMPPDAPYRYQMARIRGGGVAAVASRSPSAAWTTYVRVADADETADRVRAAGGRVLMEPEDVGPAGRMAAFADPAGAAFRVWQAGGFTGATVVNEHGSVNFNDLLTPDLDGARSFYGAVFGWEALDLGAGLMWALPAYGDFLEQRSPGLRARTAQMGAPERFEEVVATLGPVSGDQPAHWGVTFAVDDADRIAARAAELGGRVVAEPRDAPWVRTTVVADPQGATFTASMFVPENRDLAESVAGA
jgi:predicted enzyme related to lactoylglutathione lyase